MLILKPKKLVSNQRNSGKLQQFRFLLFRHNVSELFSYTINHIYLLKHFDLRLKEKFTKQKRIKEILMSHLDRLTEPEQLRLPESNNSEATR